jgi:redox-sensitive bicupin YhaK (pirin superfamily)
MTLTKYPHEALGHADHGWLNARHHFSFGSYRDPQRTGFGTLLVINDDSIEAHKGFAPHPHRDMEIITYVRTGAITHEDSNGNKGRTGAGDLQVMSAGTGITHSEWNHEDETTTLFQIWITPKENGIAPHWDAKAFPKEVGTSLGVLVSGRPEDDVHKPLYIHQDAAIYGGRLAAGTATQQAIKYQADIVVSDGELEVNGERLKTGDGMEVLGTDSISIKAHSEAELLVIDIPEA